MSDPAPGSPEAIAAGCLCPAADPERPIFAVHVHCPLHRQLIAQKVAELLAEKHRGVTWPEPAPSP